MDSPSNFNSISVSPPPYYEFKDYDYFGQFITDKDVKYYWTAFFILYLYWGFFWFTRHIFGDGILLINREEAVHRFEESQNEGNRTWIAHPIAMKLYTRLNRASNMVRDLVLLLLAALIVNTVARGGTRSVMILSFIYLGMAIFWSLFEIVYEHHLVRLSYSIMFYGILITIGGIAFRNGFDQYD